MKTRKPTDDIFNLIKSLNKVEAGYFVQYISRSRIKESEQYIHLFQLLRSADEYKESELKADIKSPAFLKRLAFHKNVLTDLVIDSLVAYKSSTSVDNQLHRLTEAINHLCEKQLFTHALKLVDKARKLAQHYEKYFALLELNHIHRILLKNAAQINLGQSVEDLYAEKKELLKKIENQDHIGYINDKVFALYRELHQVKTIEKKAELEKILQDPLLGNEDNALSFHAKLKFNTIHALHHQLYGNFTQTHQRIIELWDLHPHMKTEYHLRYYSDLANHISYTITSGNNLDFDDITNRLESNSAATKESSAALFSEVYFLQQLYFLNKGQNERALELIPKIEKGLKQFGNSIKPSRALSFIYNIAITYFMNEHYAEAIKSFDRIIAANRKHEVRTDLRDVCGIFKIILLYQTGKHDLAEYEVRNTRDRLKYGNKLYELEQIVLEYIPLLIKSQKERPNFLAKLEELFSRPENKNLLGLEEIIIWLRKKSKF